jgi:Na+/alanine symporter
LPYILQILAAIFDFMILSGYITCAVLLTDNYHSNDKLNPLRNWLIYIRIVNGESNRHRRSSALVKLLDACVIIMIFLFFFTTLLSAGLAMLHAEERRYERAATREVVEVEEVDRRRQY